MWRRAVVVRQLLIALAVLCTAAAPAGASWYTFHRLIPSPGGSFYFGAAMAAVDDRFLVGDPGDDTGGPFTGAVHLIDARTGETLLTIVHPDPEPYAQFGLTVALRGPDIVVGAPQQPVDGLGEVGVVYVFDATTGVLRTTIPNPTPAEDDFFAQALTANDADILVGARGDGDPLVPGIPSPGAAYLFDGGSGQLLHTFHGPSPLTLSFGSAVGFVGADPLVGAVNDSTRAAGEGAAYLFDRTTGLQRLRLRRPSAEQGAAFGSRVGSIGGRPLGAAVFDDLAETDAGAIYLFDEAGSVAGAFPNPFPEHVVPGGVGQVTLDAIDDRLLAAGFSHHSDGSTPGGDSVYVIDTHTGDVLQTLEAPPPYGTELSATYVVATGGRIVVSSFGQLFVFDPAGNAYLGNGEECDDGNTADGDGCSSRSVIEVEVCPPAPRTDCHPALPRGARLRIVDADAPADRFRWRMKSPGGAADLGDPTATTRYGVCVYAGGGGAALRRMLTLEPGGSCDRGGCWRARGRGFGYQDRARLADGVGSARVKANAAGTVTFAVRGEGEHLAPPALPLALPVDVQLVISGGACWGSTFSSPAQNGGGVFEAKSD